LIRCSRPTTTSSSEQPERQDGPRHPQAHHPDGRQAHHPACHRDVRPSRHRQEFHRDDHRLSAHHRDDHLLSAHHPDARQQWAKKDLCYPPPETKDLGCQRLVKTGHGCRHWAMRDHGFPRSATKVRGYLRSAMKVRGFQHSDHGFQHSDRGYQPLDHGSRLPDHALHRLHVRLSWDGSCWRVRHHASPDRDARPEPPRRDQTTPDDSVLRGVPERHVRRRRAEEHRELLHDVPSRHPDAD
jgi:hypothetical protein